MVHFPTGKPSLSIRTAPRPESENIVAYLAHSDVVDWRTPIVSELARDLAARATSDVETARRLYEWVRDEIPHSCDTSHAVVTCRASDVLRHRTGMCFAKAHLLAAMLRAVGVPAGFCYQLLRYDPGSDDRLILHGLNGVYLESVARWIRPDPRGNKPGVDARFCLDREQLAFAMDPAHGERLHPTIFIEPLPAVVECLMNSATVNEALVNLPDGSHLSWDSKRH